MYRYLIGNPPGYVSHCRRSLVVLMVLLFAACSSAPPPRPDSGHSDKHHLKHQHPGNHQPTPAAVDATPALNLKDAFNLESIIPALADKRVVFIGETHNRYEHHLTQLEIIRRLHAINPRIAIGMEAFQQPFQRYLDAYVAGELSERELLRKSEYYKRWRFDYRHYAPILRFARQHQLPVIALNLPAELTRKAGDVGIDGLSEADKAAIPQSIDRSDAAYEARLRNVFEQHPHRNNQSFDKFLDVQLLWDEGMAERAARYIEAHPQDMLVVLAGAGHLAYGSGIPQRLERRHPVGTAIVLNSWDGAELHTDLADFLLLPQQQVLPPAGKMGMMINDESGELEVLSCKRNSACATHGIKPGDVIAAINAEPITSVADLRLVMWDKKPGDKVVLKVQRKHWIKGVKEMNIDVELQ